VTVLAWVYIVAGAAGIVYHAAEFQVKPPFHHEFLWVELLRAVAIVCGVFMLRGSNWARWLALAWIAYHVVLSAFHSAGELALHAVFCAVIAYFLFRPSSARYFRQAAGGGL
jgi:hypothetical protein